MEGANSYPKTSALLQEAADFWGEQMRIELQVKRKRTSIRAKWRKSGRNWRPKVVSRGTFRAAHASAQTAAQIRVEGRMLNWGVSMPSYLQYKISGRKKGKGIPVRKMDAWIRKKNIKPKGAGNRFIKNSEKNRKAMGFMMNRKIKYFGIEPFNFVRIAKETTEDIYRPKIRKAIAQDIIKQLNASK